MAVGIRCTDYETPLSANVGSNFLTSSVCLVSIVCSHTKATEFSLVYVINLYSQFFYVTVTLLTSVDC
jgi:hypothetical protein